VTGTTGVAGADPARPTSDRSTVERIEPPADGIELRVVGGDGFLELRVRPGLEVLVPGYGGEPYLRVRDDGTVERNRRSRATYLNEDRLADVAAPPDLDDDDEPVWERVGSGGAHAWHDHRIHWMSPSRPPGLAPGDVIEDDWQVPLVVDGAEVVAHGSLVWEEPPAPLGWAALAVVAAGLTLVLGRHRVALAAPAALAGGLAALTVGWAERLAAPVTGEAGTLVVVVPAVAAAAAVTAVGAAAIGRRPTAVVACLVSVAATAGWALLRVAVFVEPVLPTALDPSLDRAGTALAAGLGVGAAVIAVRSVQPAERVAGQDRR
jgi:hypothetical protein